MFRFHTVRNLRSLALLGAGFALSLHAGVSPIDISTGVATYNLILAPGSTISCTAAPDTDCNAPATPSNTGTVVDNPAYFPFPYWPAPLGHSSWISWTPGNTLSSGSLYSEPGGLYEYQTTFILPDNTVSGSLNLGGNYSSDNLDYGVSLNGSTPAFMNSGAYPAQAFGFTGGFHTGTNTLDFFVYNIPQSSGNPEGLDVSGNVTYLTSTSSTSATPEPGFYGVLALGMAGLVFVARRHRSV